MRFKLIGLICLIMQCNLSCTQHIINKETVQTLDLHRYMGTLLSKEIFSDMI